MKRPAIANLFISAMFLAAGAGAQEISFDGGSSIRDLMKQASETDITAAPAAGDVTEKVMKDWTVMVFMNGKNNLSPYVIKDMNEMEVYGPTANMNIVTEAGRTVSAPAPSYPSYPGGGYDDYNPNPWGGGYHPGLPPMLGKAPTWNTRSTDWSGIRRYEIVKDTDTYELSSKIIETLDKADMGDWNHLVDFVNWAKVRYPARRYMLIVWNHGDGWMTKSAGPKPATKGISYDDETGNGITTVQLGMALKKIGGVDLYASDACLMQMSEVIYELKDSAPVIVGSEETEPGDGWAYDYFLQRVHQNQSNLTPEVMAKAAVEGYNAYYTEKGQGTTQSAVKTRDLVAFRTLVDQWTDLAIAKGEKDLLKKAAAEAKGYEGVDSKDFTDFMTLVSAKTAVPELKARSEEVKKFIATRIVFKNSFSGDSYKNSAGLGIYLPTYGYDVKYSKLAWSAAGKWDEFIQWLNK